MEKWRQYFKELLDGEIAQHNTTKATNQEVEISMSEIKQAVANSKKSEALRHN